MAEFCEMIKISNRS